jgi:hypothetical protein
MRMRIHELYGVGWGSTENKQMNFAHIGQPKDKKAIEL